MDLGIILCLQRLHNFPIRLDKIKKLYYDRYMENFDLKSAIQRYKNSGSACPAELNVIVAQDGLGPCNTCKYKIMDGCLARCILNKYFNAGHKVDNNGMWSTYMKGLFC